MTTPLEEDPQKPGENGLNSRMRVVLVAALALIATWFAISSIAHFKTPERNVFTVTYHAPAKKNAAP